MNNYKTKNRRKSEGKTFICGPLNQIKPNPRGGEDGNFPPGSYWPEGKMQQTGSRKTGNTSGSYMNMSS